MNKYRKLIYQFMDENLKGKTFRMIERNMITNKWEFRINNDYIVDYLILTGWSNLKIAHIWLIDKNNIVGKNSITITNRSKYLSIFKMFEITDKIIIKNDIRQIYEKGSMGHFLELAKKDGFEGLDAVKKWNEWRKKNGKLPNYTKIDRDRNNQLARERGYKDHAEYLRKNRDIWAQRKGYRNHAEKQTMYRWNKGTNPPISENEYCSSYIGVYIGEDLIAKSILDMLFEFIEKKNYGNIGFEYICKSPRQEIINKYPIFEFNNNKEYKIDVKTTRLLEHNYYIGYHFWNFSIRYNKIADYFLLIGMDIEGKEILHIWLFKKDTIIREREFWRFHGFGVTNKRKHLLNFQKYELEDELENLKFREVL